ncbi:MAG: hypothetical protein RI885_1152, partial [Actinomycetota bacterium]
MPHTAQDPLDLGAMASRLADLPDVVGVVLGGSRARGTHHPDSDVDLGIYYRGILDTERIETLARTFGGPETTASPLGGWGPWVDGGAWLTVDGVAVDWIYRDLDRVEEAVGRASAGEATLHRQLGHPFGFYDVAYAGELALGRLLEDRVGSLAAARAPVVEYPTVLSSALVANLGDADFLIGVAQKGARRGDTVYVAACLAEAVFVAAHALHAAAGQWLINEKGAIAAAGALDTAPDGFADDAAAALAAPGASPESLTAAIGAARRVIAR